MKQDRGSGHRWLTRAEVAAIFQVAPSTITRWAEAGKLPVIKTLGGHRRYDADVVKVLAQQYSPDLFSSNETILDSKELNMAKTVIDVPAMYGDHHVLEVRHMLLALSGVEEVTASSCFQAVEVSFDPAQTNEDTIKAVLDEGGYLAPLPIPVESGIAVTLLPEEDRAAGFRHTIAYEQARDVVSFAHSVPQQTTSHVLWPCPGLGVLRNTEAAGDGQEKETSYA
jgi:excisionase family DNA binding protein